MAENPLRDVLRKVRKLALRIHVNPWNHFPRLIIVTLR